MENLYVVYSLNALNSYTSRLNSYIPNQIYVFCVEKFKMRRRRRRFELKYFLQMQGWNGNKDETNNHSMYTSYFYIFISILFSIHGKVSGPLYEIPQDH